MESKSTTDQTCPNCQSELTADKNFSPWCADCEWNLTFSEPAEPRNLFESFYLSISRKHGEALFDSLVKADPKRLRPAITFSKLTAFALAALVHSLTIFLIVFGLSLLFFGWPNFLAVGGGIVCLMTSWLTRPRFAAFPKNAISRKDFPVLYDLTDSIAAALGTKSVDAIVIDGHFNAAFGQVGWKGKKILYIGLPLWKILSEREKIALIAHELSHGINGDPLRGIFIRTAVDSLIVWHGLLKPDQLWNSENALIGLLLIPFNVLLLFLSFVSWLGAYALSYLLWMNSQKAEYLADYLATEVCGTKPMTDLLEKCELGDKYLIILRKFSVRDEKKDLFEAFRLEVSSLPAGEKERTRRITKRERSRLDSTHPPTFFRIEFLKNHFEKNSTAALSEERARQIDAELFRIHRRVQAHITEKYNRSLYY